MPTYLDTVVRIQTDFLNRTDFSDTVKRAINTAVRHYQRERFWFNETSTVLTCQVGIETIVKPSDFLFLDYLQVTQNSSDTVLIQKPFDFIRRINIDQSTGLPTVYCEYGENFHLANVPDSAYPVPCFYVQQMAPLVNDSDTNNWLSAAEDVIVYAASKLVWAATIRNMSAAGVCAQMETAAISELRRQRDQQQHAPVRLTRF